MKRPPNEAASVSASCAKTIGCLARMVTTAVPSSIRSVPIAAAALSSGSRPNSCADHADE